MSIFYVLTIIGAVLCHNICFNFYITPADNKPVFILKESDYYWLIENKIFPPPEVVEYYTPIEGEELFALDDNESYVVIENDSDLFAEVEISEEELSFFN